jgi:hypothetical protein
MNTDKDKTFDTNSNWAKINSREAVFPSVFISVHPWLIFLHEFF